MTYGSICSGIAADHLAFDQFNCQWFSEIEKFPCAVLEHHYPDIPNHGDITDGIEKYTAVDLIVGGTPCQGFSVAGKREGLDDDRSNLALRFLEIIAHTRPQWVVWENVPGVFSTGGGRDFGAFIGELGKRGYGWAYRTLDAQYFGVPQRRRRVFVVGYLGDWRPAAAVLFERHSLQGHPAPSKEAGEDTAATAGEGFTPASHGGYRRGTGSLRANGGDLGGGSENLIAFNAGDRRQGVDTICEDGTSPPVIQKAGTGGNNMPLVQRTIGALQARDRKGIGTTVDDKVVLHRANGRSGYQSDEVAGPVRESGKKQADTDLVQSGDLSQKAEGIGWKDNIASCIAKSTKPGHHNHISQGMSVRRLTPRECERLMGFPDSFTKIPYRGKAAEQCPDGPRYAALGNSIAVPVLKWIGDRIMMVEELR